MRTATYGMRLVLAAILLTGLITPLNLGLARASGESDAGYENAIKHLNVLIKTSPTFKNDIEAALRTQDGCSYYWDNKDIEYFINFFQEWLVYNSPPWAGPKYIQPFDELANSEGGEILFNNNVFSSWFIEFLDARGQYLGTPQSLREELYKEWNNFPDIDLKLYNPPPSKKKNPPPSKTTGGYASFNALFLRDLKNPLEPDGAGDMSVLVSPANGTIHQIYAQDLNTEFEVKRDVINIRQALNNSPHAEKFIGGKMVDILLWFTDYHHFHAPISGTVIEMNGYAGSYNYNFKNVDWYKALAKHKRLCYIIQSKEFGLVAMIPVGFWGVGSIVSTVKEGDIVTKGDKIGRFGFGGSSILLVFEPNAIEFTIPGIKDEWKKIKAGDRIGVAPKK